jgi:hypothetical protein
VKDANGLVVAEQTHEDKFKDGYLYGDVLMKRSAILDPSKNIPPVLFVNRRTAHARNCYSFLSLVIGQMLCLMWEAKSFLLTRRFFMPVRNCSQTYVISRSTRVMAA